ncbi:hypothetical protein EBAPG3_002475 [Nitrosospira lacus]|uniref:Uncharacterized protein n=1 Tax=Nitrosospira lacus TaxID=1288494 RepID=A0A1W6SLR1_9PROT|nr:hypothetical protein EBAPG3_002475 [Nitrosospira lacus]
MVPRFSVNNPAFYTFYCARLRLLVHISPANALRCLFNLNPVVDRSSPSLSLQVPAAERWSMIEGG